MDTKVVNKYEQREKKHYWYKTRRHIVKSIIKKKRFKNLLFPKPYLLEIGCGAGINLSYLHHTFHCVGIEPNPVLANQARHNSQATIYQHPFPLNLTSLNNKFDCILLLDVLEHVDDDLEILNSALSLLNNEGIIIINVPAMPVLWSTHDKVAHHKRRYTHHSLQRIIRQSSLKPIHIRYWNSLALPLAYLQRRIIYQHTPSNQYQLHTPPKIINNLYHNLLLIEYYITKPLKIPFGLSLLAVVTKNS